MPEPRHGEVLVKVHYLSLDPYQRGRMRDAASYAAPVGLGEVMTGGIVGEVVNSQQSRASRSATSSRIGSAGRNMRSAAGPTCARSIPRWRRSRPPTACSACRA